VIVWSGWLGALVVAGALAIVPGAWRAVRSRRRRRLVAIGGPPGVAAAFGEVRDTARDLGLGAPVTETPRALAARLERWWAGVGHNRAAEAAAEGALVSLTEAVEAAAYADAPVGGIGTRGLAAIVRRLRLAVPRRRRALARLWPISLVRGLSARRPGTSPASGTETTRRRT
jgi:hypothetical protein